MKKPIAKIMKPSVFDEDATGFVWINDVQFKPIMWLWDGYIPKGGIVLIEGNPGEGKSHLTSFLAACVSAGNPLPDGVEIEPRTVIIVNGEDPAGIQAIRIQAAGGDLKRVLLWPDPEAAYKAFHLPQGIDVLKKLATKHNVGLIVIDPLNAHLDPKLKIYNDQDMKLVLQQLNKLAQDLNIPIIAVRHLKKAQMGSAIVSGLGSIGIIGSARAAFIVGPDPDGSGDKILACSKMNFGPKATSLRFQIVSATVKSVIGEDVTTSKFEWLGDSHHTADDLCKPDKGPEGSALEYAVEFLKEVLAEGAMPSKDVKAQAKEEEITIATLNRAKKALGIKPQKGTPHGYWELPKPKE